MIRSNTEKAAEENRDGIAKAEEALKEVNELLAALKPYKGKIVDMRFFKAAGFVEKGEFREYCRFNLTPPEYSFSSYKYRIYLRNHYQIELQSRETAHVIAKAEEEKERIEKSIAYYREHLDELALFDEAAMIKDLQAVYFKHGKPQLWSRILESHDVKYPDND